MNLSLKTRVATSFILANVVVLTLGLIVFHFLDSLNRNIEKITSESNRVTLLTDEIRMSAVSILKYQRRLITSKGPNDSIEKLMGLCEGFTSQLQTLDTLYQGVETKQVIAKMLGYVDSLLLLLKNKQINSTNGGANGFGNSLNSINQKDIANINSTGDLADKILEAFTEFQDIQYFQSADRDKKIKTIIKKTKRNMMYTLIITFIGAMLLALVIPGTIALPFKKINDAIRELQNCNFDVSIYYDRDDEIGEISQEINKMIASLKKYEELRADRILVEGRKFDALANTVKKHILVANAMGELIYMNNNLYSLLQLQSDDILNKNIRDTLIPEPIIHVYELAIKRRSKIENEEIFISRNEHGLLDGDELTAAAVASVSSASASSSAMDSNGERNSLQEIFRGYANVIPIRGKESSLDYYLMILSEELFI
ncbi:MAG: HAMP domain-containing protein [Oligoflexia bacterium]|nr:HAMP domain-containing protein [Oligoflexia bacterium]